MQENHSLWTKDVRERLKTLIEAKYTQTEFANKLGISPATLNHLLNRDNEPRLSRITRIAEELHVSLDHILTGQVEGMRAVFSLSRIPLLDISVSAGDGVEALEAGQSTEALEFPEDWLRENFGRIEGLRLMRVKGDSMEPKLVDGSLLMIDINLTENSDGLYVVRYYDQLLVKRVQFEGKTVRLSSENASYHDTIIDLSNNADREALRLIGRAVWSGNAM